MSWKDLPKLRSFWDFPSARRSWSSRREQQHSIESNHHLSSDPDCNNTADISSFFRRAVHSAIPFVSDRWSVLVWWSHDNSSQYLPNSNKLSVWITFGFCDGKRNFRKFFSVPCEVLVCHGLWRELVPRQRIGDCSEIHILRKGFCALLLPSHHTFLFAEEISLGFCGRKHKHCASVFVYLHFWSLTFRIWVHSFSGMCEHSASRSTRLFVFFKVCNQTRMPCVGSPLFISFAGSRFLVACLPWSVSIGFPHACLSLRVCTGSDNGPNFSGKEWSFVLDVEDKNAAGIWWHSWYNEKYWVAQNTSNWLPIRGQLWSFVIFHSCAHTRFEQHLWRNRIAGVSSSNCTVANRSRSRTQTGVYSFICTAPGPGESHMVFWTFSKYPLHLSSNLLAQQCALKLPSAQLTYDLLCLRPSQKNKT